MTKLRLRWLKVFELPYSLSIHKGFHRSSPTAHFSLMRPFIVIVEKPEIRVLLELVEIRVDFLAEGDLVKFLKNGFVNTINLMLF